MSDELNDMEMSILKACYEFVKNGNIGMEAIDGYYGFDSQDEDDAEDFFGLSKKI